MSTYSSIPSAGTRRKRRRAFRSVDASRYVTPRQQRVDFDQTKSLPPRSRTKSTAPGEAITFTLEAYAQSRLHGTGKAQAGGGSIRLETVRRLVPAVIFLTTLCLILAA
jgi:hypothetical protein